MTSLNKEHFWFSSKGRALGASEVRGQLRDGHLLPIDAIDDAPVPMGEDAADKAVPVAVVHTLVVLQRLADRLRCQISAKHCLEMKLREGAAQGLWKGKERRKIVFPPRSRALGKRADVLMKNGSQSLKTFCTSHWILGASVLLSLARKVLEPWCTWECYCGPAPCWNTF